MKLATLRLKKTALDKMYSSYSSFFQLTWGMVDRSSSLSEARLSLVHGGSYGSESPEDLRQMEEREYVKRIKDDIHERQMAYAYRSIHCNGKLQCVSLF
jgi:hypothetical protein